MQERYVGVHVSDVHWGAADPEKLDQELREHLYSFVQENHEEIDYLTVLGDYFDKQLGLNDKSAKYALAFLNELVYFCMTHEIKVRLLRGTATHDFNQLQAFSIFETLSEDEDGSPDFRIISKSESEFLFPNFKVLYVPEEYPKNFEDYYGELLAPASNYNAVFGHGTLEFQAFANQKQESERPINTAPVFSMKRFASICNGPIVFGHIHTRVNWKKKAFYCSSFTRTAHGESGIKGFCYSDTGLLDGDFSVEYVDNTSAPEYKTFDFDKLLDRYETIEEIGKIATKLAKKYYKIRIRFAESYPNEKASSIAVLRSALTEIRNIDFDIRKRTSEEIEQLEMVNEDGEMVNEDGEIIEKDDTFDFLIDGHAQPIETVSTFIELTKNREISPEEIVELLSTEESK